MQGYNEFSLLSLSCSDYLSLPSVRRLACCLFGRRPARLAGSLRILPKVVFGLVAACLARLASFGKGNVQPMCAWQCQLGRCPHLTLAFPYQVGIQIKNSFK